MKMAFVSPEGVPFHFKRNLIRVCTGYSGSSIAVFKYSYHSDLFWARF